MHGFTDMAEYYKSSVGEGTFRNYRRGLADYSRSLKQLEISSKSLDTIENAVKVTSRVFHYAVLEGWNGERLKMMRTAVSKLFSAVFGCNFSNNSLIRDIVQSHINKNPPKKERLSLSWKLEDLLCFLRTRPLPHLCSFKDLTALSIVHLMIFKGLRFAEIHRLSPVDTSPEPNGWKFWLVIKNHRKKELVSIFPSDDKHLDTLGMLSELHSRIQGRIGDDINRYNTFWFKEVVDLLLPMTYNEVRLAAAQVLDTAGIKEHHPYHIKHATLTFLSRQGVPAAEITAFARHSYGSMSANAFYTSWDNGRALSSRIAKAASTDGKSLCVYE
jgi:site-specific recombinase XerD